MLKREIELLIRNAGTHTALQIAEVFDLTPRHAAQLGNALASDDASKVYKVRHNGTDFFCYRTARKGN